MAGKAARTGVRDPLVAVGITLALVLVAGFTVLALAYAVKSGIEGKWTEAYDAAKDGGGGVIGLGFVVYVWMRYGLVAVRRMWFSTAALARDRAVEDATRSADSARVLAERAQRADEEAARAPHDEGAAWRAEVARARAAQSRSEADAAAQRARDAERALRERFPDDPSLTQ